MLGRMYEQLPHASTYFIFDTNLGRCTADACRMLRPEAMLSNITLAILNTPSESFQQPGSGVRLQSEGRSDH